MEKMRKYERLLQSTELKQAERLEGEVIQIIIGALGTMNQDTLNELKKLKLHMQNDPLQTAVATGSINILNARFKRDDFYIN